MDFNLTTFTITKVTASEAFTFVILSPTGTLCILMQSQIVHMKATKGFETPVTVRKCRPIQNDDNPGQDGFSHESSESQKSHAGVFLSVEMDFTCREPWFEDVFIFSITSTILSSGFVCDQGGTGPARLRVCCLPEQRRPTLSAESASAVLLLCRGDDWPQTVASALVFA